MPDFMLEPGRPQSGGIRFGIKPIPLDSVLRPEALETGDVQKAEGMEGQEEPASDAPSTDQISEELQQALEHWTEGSLKKLAMEVQERLTDALLSWEPDPKKSEEENLREIRETVRRYGEVLSSKGSALQINKPLEAALLETLSKWLEQIASRLLHLLSSAESADEIKGLLEKLFRQITGISPSKNKVSAQAAAVLQRAAGHRQFSQTQQFSRASIQLPEEGVLYRRGKGGIRLDSGYSGQAQRAIEREARSMKLNRGTALELETELQSLKPGVASPRLFAVSQELEMVRELRFVENFVKNISGQPVLPSAKELPYVSEERLGLEIGLLWLKGEAAAREPGVTSHTAALIRQATEQRTENFLYEAGLALQLSARGYPPGQCPNLWREDVFRVREELIRRYRQTKDPQRSLMDAIAYAVELFREKQEKGKYRTWLRYLPGRGLFLDQFGWEDIKQGWQEFCQSWERFLQEMGLRNTPLFQGTVALQSLWGMILPPSKKMETANAASLWSLAGWLFTAAATAAVVYALWSAVSVLARVAAIVAACFFSGFAFLLLRKSRKR